MRGLLNIFACVLLWVSAIVGTVGLAALLLLPYCLLVFVGERGRAAKVQARLASILIEGEDLVAVSLQKRAFSLASRRLLVAITSSRIVTIRRGLIGGFTMQDIQWKDLRDVSLSENVLPALCGSNLSFDHMSEMVGQVVVQGVESEVAAAIYSRAQAEEQAWEEKRRIRSIEEKRAAAGGVYVSTPTSAHGPAPKQATPGGGMSNALLDQLKQTKELLDLGAISDAEYQEMKARILAS